jgi:molybdate transport system regulatory protein
MSRVVLRTKVWIEVAGDFAIGEGGLELLEALSSDGSLTRAAAQVEWSYRHAWGYLRRAERALGVRLTLPVPGKGARRGMVLTPAAEDVISTLQHARDRVRQAVDGLSPVSSQR